MLCLFILAVAPGVIWKEAAVGGGDPGFDYTTHADCEGAWLIYSNGVESGAVSDACGSRTMVWADSSWVESSGTPRTPAGTPGAQDAASFTGATNGWMEYPDDVAFEGGFITFGCWMYPETSSLDVIFSKSSFDWEIRADGGAITRVDISDDVGQSATSSVEDGWTNIIVRYDTEGTQPDSVVDEIEIFTNGLSDCLAGSCQTSPGPDGTTAVIRIGSENDGGRPFVGDLMECFFISSALSDNQIAEITICGFDGLADPNDSTGRGSYGGATCTTNPEAGCC